MKQYKSPISVCLPLASANILNLSVPINSSKPPVDASTGLAPRFDQMNDFDSEINEISFREELLSHR
ncbi:MAG: hypothetical protein MSH18_06325 [Bacteroidales bacterium]|nr:hypothetical protein [Bacteroidales bacterium]